MAPPPRSEADLAPEAAAASGTGRPEAGEAGDGRPAMAVPAGPLPIAMAAITVDGRCRERNPADLAIFGERADRLIARFLDPGLGQSMLAAAVADGIAEAPACLTTAAGARPFRVSLWRQRGGERIRVLGAFAGDAPPAPAPPPDTRPALPGDGGAAEILVRALRAPLRAAIGAAERLRDQGTAAGGEAVARGASDILAAGWRLTRLADDLLAAPPGRLPAPRALGEVDPVRLIRRLLRLAAGEFTARGILVEEERLPPPGAAPLVLADESLLWLAFETLLWEAAAEAGPDGRIALGLARTAGGGAVLEIAAQTGTAAPIERAPPRLASSGGLGPELCGPILASIGLALEPQAGEGPALRIHIPPESCLDPP
ncbi:hypothetical protein LNKW23_02120 [Paralimibaculum aggregatum]|uniref:Sensor histidine kinase n=1 Tax=Paralimibaculum aggregatum TaxID=3036245 RepID=A0ABQ6LC92_9RHOB|nr:hypothetical protein [Limibaculum sp. NKW23]GMG81000.1 hypothetical protein LNKW23_02120 [Limibaculum sp. NKW23]